MTSQTEEPKRRRWIKVSVDEDLFLAAHDAANQSRMRMSTYVRTLLNEGLLYNDLVDVPFKAPRQT